MVLPPCLSADLDAHCLAIVAAEERFYDLKLALAIIRRAPDPDAAAERNHYEPADAGDDPFDPEDDADWAA